jgi:hypothetical protein
LSITPTSNMVTIWMSCAFSGLLHIVIAGGSKSQLDGVALTLL